MTRFTLKYKLANRSLEDSNQLLYYELNVTCGSRRGCENGNFDCISHGVAGSAVSIWDFDVKQHNSFQKVLMCLKIIQVGNCQKPSNKKDNDVDVCFECFCDRKH